MNRKKQPCQDWRTTDRRGFVKALGGAALAGVAAPLVFDARFAHAGPTPASAAETTVGQFYASLSATQQKAICLPFDHALRQRINPNWHVRKTLIGDNSFTTEQRALVNEIVAHVTTEDGYARLQRQMDDDDGGIENYSVAVFGKPGEGKFQWELTGRHLTLRADGDSVDKAAFGGPIIYGHGEEDIKENLFYYQTKMANKVFAALDAKQAERALLKKAPRETAVSIRGSGASFPGISVKQLSSDQKELVEATLKSVLGPYREEDRDEVIEMLKGSGGLDALHMAFYQQEDLDDDKVWDIWRIEGPSIVCHFRGAPHVHAYINVGIPGNA
jgi:hypothetical protein